MAENKKQYCTQSDMQELANKEKIWQYEMDALARSKTRVQSVAKLWETSNSWSIERGEWKYTLQNIGLLMTITGLLENEKFLEERNETFHELQSTSIVR